MIELTPEEKRAGRWFRDTLAIPAMEKQLNRYGDVVEVPPYLHFVRHECAAHPGHSTWAVELREWYVLSPPMLVFAQGRAPDVTWVVRPVQSYDVTEATVPEGFFCWLWKGGSCSCGYSVRSGGGRMVVSSERPPLRGAAEVRLDTP